MASFIERWQEQMKTSATQLGNWLTERRQRDLPFVVYGSLLGLTVWPLVEVAARSGPNLPAELYIALGSLAGNVGANLVADWLVKWKDKAQTLEQTSQAAIESAMADPQLRQAFEQLIANLEVIPLAQTKLERQQQWFMAALRQEMSGLNSSLLPILEALVGIEQNTDQIRDSSERSANALEELLRLVEPVAATLSAQISPKNNPTQLKEAAKRYLAYLLDRYRNLDLKGMGFSDRLSFNLPLVEMYVPLKVRRQMPQGEAWARDLRLAGRPPTKEEIEVMGERVSEPQPVLKLLQEKNNLILLGDPGSGKTTFLKYLTVRLALGHWQELELGNRLPILLPLSAYADQLEKGEIALPDFIHHYYHQQGLDLPLDDLIKIALDKGQALFLLDGLDEVRALEKRHLVVERVISFVAFHKPAGNQFILSSRIVGYNDVRPQGHSLVECTLIDFEPEDVAAFIDNWTQAIERALRSGNTPEAQRVAKEEKEGLLHAVRHSPGVGQLAANPLLLTILALMKRQGVALPERRAELYDQYVKTLIRHWNLTRSLNRPAAPDLDVVETSRILAALALWMQENSPGRGLVKQAETERQLQAIYRQRGHARPEQAARELLQAVREYAGLLVARGERQYGFIHLTFQEYLAAVGIAQLGQLGVQPIVDQLQAHLSEADWHEVALLTIGYLGLVTQADQAASQVLIQLMDSTPNPSGVAVVLAGEAVADVWPGGVTEGCRQLVVERLQTTMTNEAVGIAVRAAAGRFLSILGDPRPGVTFTLRNGQKIPDIVWGKTVPAGSYTIGDKLTTHPDEQPRSVTIAQPYQLARYPVTHSQFQCFVEAADFADPRWWAGMPKKDYYGPVREIGPAGFPFANHPRENVSWYQAIAFCRWLSQQVGYEVDLPHEHEWEVAARYPHNGAYPWEGDFKPEKANTDESNLRQTTAVGMYPAGANQHLDLYDLSGNVWEWCRNKYADPTDIAIDRSGNTRTLRGGSWGHYPLHARAASRLNASPDLRSSSVGWRLVRRSHL